MEQNSWGVYQCAIIPRQKRSGVAMLEGSERSPKGGEIISLFLFVPFNMITHLVSSKFKCVNENVSESVSSGNTVCPYRNCSTHDILKGPGQSSCGLCSTFNSSPAVPTEHFPTSKNKVRKIWYIFEYVQFSCKVKGSFKSGFKFGRQWSSPDFLLNSLG